MNVVTLALLPLMTNCYIAYEREGGKCFIIDPASNEERIIQTLNLMRLKPKAILLTHGHFDHIGAADSLRDHYSIPLIVHEADAKMIKSPILNCASAFMGMNVALRDADKLVKDGDVLKLEKESLRVLHTPGHSEGSCVYVGNDLIFSGDTVFRGSYGRYDLYGGNYGELMESVRRVLELDTRMVIYPGHDETTTVLDERENYHF